MKPIYDHDGITLYCSDWQSLSPQSADLVWTDPPYNVGKDYGVADDNLPDEEYLTLTAEWIQVAKKTAKEIAIYTPTKYLLKYWNLLGPEYKQIILTWTPEGAIRGTFVNQFASILTNAKPKQRTKDVWNNMQMRGMGYFFKENDFGHPGYTSEAITSKVISSFTDEDAVVFDPFLGTGTTAVICKRLGRKFVGCEINEKYCQIAIERLRQSVIKFERGHNDATEKITSSEAD